MSRHNHHFTTCNQVREPMLHAIIACESSQKCSAAQRHLLQGPQGSGKREYARVEKKAVRTKAGASRASAAASSGASTSAALLIFARHSGHAVASFSNQFSMQLRQKMWPQAVITALETSSMQMGHSSIAPAAMRPTSFNTSSWRCSARRGMPGDAEWLEEMSVAIGGSMGQSSSASHTWRNLWQWGVGRLTLIVITI
jgi:hypothetical protein